MSLQLLLKTKKAWWHRLSSLCYRLVKPEAIVILILIVVTLPPQGSFPTILP